MPLESTYGIVGVDSELTLCNPTDSDTQLISKHTTLKYLGDRQQSTIPFLPIRGKNERQLVHRELNKIAANQLSFTNVAVFEELSKTWYSHHVSVASKIYPKMPSHFMRYIKSWRKNQDRRDAEISSGTNRLNDALEYIPESEVL